MLHPSAKTVIVSGTGISLIETVKTLPLEHTITFGIQTLIGLLTVVYLISRIYNELKTKKS